MSGRTLIVPVISGRGTLSTGQKLDRSKGSNSSLWQIPIGSFWCWLGAVLTTLLLFGVVVPAAKSRRTVHLESLRLAAEAEIDEMHAQYLGALGDFDGLAVAAIYARFSTDKQSSVADQVRACLSFALKDGLHVPRHLIFSDFAVTGRKENRPGLNQVRQAITNHEATVLLVLSTNRLFRGLFSSLKFVNESIVANNVRYVAVDRGLDSAKENIWRLVLSLLAIMDELSSTLYQGNIRAAHTSRAEKGEVWGALTFGYRFSERDDEVSGSQRRRYEIDSVAAEWVRRIFHWFTKDGISINEIVRRLCNTANVPVPPWSSTGTWSRPVVSRVLRNQRYRGDWSYGCVERTWNTAKDRAIMRKRSEPLQRIQHEELRIIDESLWLETQAMLAKNKGDRGRKTSDGKRQPTTFLLTGLLYCKEHNQLLYRSGPKGEDYFRCPTCIAVDATTRPLFTFCDGRLALHCLLKALQELILGGDILVDKIISACRSAAEEQAQPGEAELEVHRTAIRKFTRSIDLLVDNPGDSKEDQKDSGDRLKRLRAEQNRHSAQLEKLRKQAASPAKVPTTEEVKAHLQDLSAAMQRVIDDPNLDLDGLSAARNILRQFTGEKVLISQAGERKQHHGWLLAEFENDFVKLCADKLGGGESCSCGSTRVVVEIRRPDANAELGRTVVELRDQHQLPFNEIGRRLKMTRNRASRLYEQYSDAIPNDANMPAKQGRCRLEPPLPERVADQVMELVDQGMLIVDICERLDISSSTVTAAMQHWYTVRGRKPVDGRTRRKSLKNKQRPTDRLGG